MAATVITVTATYLNPDGSAASGKVTLALSEPIANANVIYHVQPQIATLNGDGTISQPLVANDDTATTPTGSFYTVTEDIEDAPQREYVVVIPHAASDATVDLSTLMPSTAPGIGG